MSEKNDWEPSTSEANPTTSTATRGRPRKSGGGRKSSTRKSAPPKKPAKKPKATKKRRKSADWAEFKPIFEPDSVLTDELAEKYIEIVEKAAEEVINMKTIIANEEFDNLFLDDEEENEEEGSEHTESKFDEEDEDDSFENRPESPAPKIVRSAPPVETESLKMIYFEPIFENVKGRNEYQLSNTPLMTEHTKDMAICSGVYKFSENGTHGYLENTFESSPEIIFNVMKKVLENKALDFNPDFFYYAMNQVFPNTGCQKEMAEMYPRLVRMFTEDEDERQRLLALEPWKDDF